MSPIDFRYISKDDELIKRVREYAKLDIFTKLKRATSDVVIPRLHSLENRLLCVAKENKEKQIPRRIDGVHEGEISLDEVFIGYAERLKKRILDIKKLPLDFDCLNEAKRNDRISDLVYFPIIAFSMQANIANDIRHGFRDEISEFSHGEFLENRIGYSTMPHKRNPIEYEQVVSLWKAYTPRINSAILNQLTEHQGDSTNKDSPYYAFELLFVLAHATRSLEKALENLKISV